MIIDLQNGMKVKAETLIDDFGIGLNFMYDLDKEEKKYFYVKLSQREAKELAIILQLVINLY